MPVRGRASQEGRRRWHLSPPTARATLGAALVVAAAGGVLVAHRSATTPPASRFLVTTRDISPGQVVTEEDLGTLAMELPDGVGAVPAADADSIVGRTAAGPLHELDLVRPDDVRTEAAASPGSVEVSVQLDASRTPSDLRPGQVVSLLATASSGGTEVLARRTRIAAVEDRSDSGIGGSDGVRVRVVLGDEEAAAAVVDAAVTAELTAVLPTDDGARGG